MKSIIIGVIVGLLGVAGGVTMAVLTAPTGEPPVIIEEQPEVTPEPEPAPEPEDLPEEPILVDNPVTAKPTKQPAELPATSSSSLSYWDDWARDLGLYTNVDYVRYYLGKCPHEQPAGNPWWTPYRFLATTGVYPSDFYSDPQHHLIETYWGHWKDGRDMYDGGISSFYNLGLTGEAALMSATVFVDWSTLSVYWDATWQDNRPWKEHIGSYPAEWDTVVANMQSYLRSLESKYNSLCPND